MQKENRKLSTILAMDFVNYSSKMAEDDAGNIRSFKKEVAIWHEMTVIEEMMPVYLEYGLK